MLFFFVEFFFQKLKNYSITTMIQNIGISTDSLIYMVGIIEHLGHFKKLKLKKLKIHNYRYNQYEHTMYYVNKQHNTVLNLNLYKFCTDSTYSHVSDGNVMER